MTTNLLALFPFCFLQPIGLVLSAFFYGYIVTQLPGGWLATKHGGKKVSELPSPAKHL